MLRTGKSGRYRYLTCAKKTLKGCGCGQSVRMGAIDECVLSALEQKGVQARPRGARSSLA